MSEAREPMLVSAMRRRMRPGELVRLPGTPLRRNYTVATFLHQFDEKAADPCGAPDPDVLRVARTADPRNHIRTSVCGTSIHGFLYEYDTFIEARRAAQ